MSSSFGFLRGVFSMPIDSEIIEAEIASLGLDSSSLELTLTYSSESYKSYEGGRDSEIGLPELEHEEDSNKLFSSESKEFETEGLLGFLSYF